MTIAAGIVTGALALLVAVVGVAIVLGSKATDSVKITAGGADLLICTITEDLPVSPFARSRPLLAAGGTISDDYPDPLRDAYDRFRAESQAAKELPVEHGEAETAHAAANARFEEVIHRFC